MTLAIFLSTTSILACLALAALLTHLLVHQWRWSSSVMESAMKQDSTLREASKWNQKYVEILRDHQKSIDSLAESQKAIAEAIYSVPSTTRSVAKETLERRFSATETTPAPPRLGEIEIPSQEEIEAAMEKTAAKEPESAIDRAVGRPI